MLSPINDAELDIYLEKSESWPLPHSMHIYKFKMNYIPNEKGKTMKLPEEIRRISSRFSDKQRFLKKDIKAINCKRTGWEIGLYQY